MRDRVLMLTALALGSIALPVLADSVWESAPSLPVTERKLAAGVNQNGTLVVIGGRPLIGGEQASVHYLPPGGTAWLSGTPLDFVINQPGAGIDPDGNIIVVGGWSYDDTGPGFFPLLNGFFYDTSGGEGDGIASLNCSRVFFGFAADPQHRFYVISGVDRIGLSQVMTECVERYDPASDTWGALDPLPAARENPAAVYDGDGHILVVGGADGFGNSQSTVFSFDIAAPTWSTINSQPAALQSQSAALGADGRVYVVGGFASNANFPTASVYIYDPTSGQWSTGPSLNTALHLPAIATGDDGYIYVMGGSTTGSGATNAVERLNTNPLTIDVAMRVVDVAAPTMPEEGLLPPGLSQICPGADFSVELWVSQVDGGAEGISGGSVDLLFDATLFAAVSIDHGSIFSNPSNPDVIDNINGVVDNVGGATLAASTGVAPDWALLARVRMTPGTAGPWTSSLAHGAFAFALAGGMPPLPDTAVDVSAMLTVPVAIVDDNVGCTTDVCQSATGQVTHTADDTACDDGVNCTADTCDPAYDCQFTPDHAACNDSDACTTDTCDPATGDVTTGCLNTPVNVDDGVTCTVDACDSGTGVITHTADHAACNDGMACTVDACDATAGCLNRAIYDLELNGSIDFGDFSLFAGHFATFDGDPDYLDCADFYFDGVIEAADVSYFATAIAKPCSDPSVVLPEVPFVPPSPCPSTALARGAGTGAADGVAALELRTVVLESSSEDGDAEHLPMSWRGPVQPGRAFVIEIWARLTGTTAAGLTGGTVDIFVDPLLARISDVSTDDRFGLFVMGDVDALAGIVDDVGGATLEAGIGVGTWVRFVQVGLIARSRGVLEVRLRVGRLGFAEYSKGTIADDAVTTHGRRLFIGGKRLPGHLRHSGGN